MLSRRGRGVSRGLPLRPQTATAEPEAILEHRLEDSVGSNGDGRDNDEGGANKTSETTEARALEDEVKSKDNRDERTEESKEGKSVTDGGVVGGGARGELRTLKHLESVSESIRNSPGFKFLIRPDLYKFVKVGRRFGKGGGRGAWGDGLNPPHYQVKYVFFLSTAINIYIKIHTVHTKKECPRYSGNVSYILGVF